MGFTAIWLPPPTQSVSKQVRRVHSPPILFSNLHHCLQQPCGAWWPAIQQAHPSHTLWSLLTLFACLLCLCCRVTCQVTCTISTLRTALKKTSLAACARCKQQASRCWATQCSTTAALNTKTSMAYGISMAARWRGMHVR